MNFLPFPATYQLAAHIRRATCVALALGVLPLQVVVAQRSVKAASPAAVPARISTVTFEESGAPIDLAAPDGIRVVSGGGILFSDTKPVTVRIGDAASAKLKTVGRAGAGPGEYRTSPLFVGFGADSIAAYDAALQRWSVLSASGLFVRVLATGPGAGAHATSAAWVAPGAIVFNASVNGPRAPLAETVRLVQWAVSPNGTPIIVRQADGGDLWAAPTFASKSWTVFDRAGRKRETIQFATPFKLQYANDTLALGSTIDADDLPQIVQVRMRPVAPAKSTQSKLATSDVAATQLADAQTLLKSFLRKSVSKQEAAYSDNNQYTTNVELLRLDLPTNVQFVIVEADKRGWFGIITDKETRVTCAAGVGFGVIGWTEGQPYCSK